MEVEQRFESEAEQRLLDELRELIGRGHGSLGVKPTLHALWLGAVNTLVLEEGRHEAGSECPSCGRLEPGRVASCPRAGHRCDPRTICFMPRAAARRLREDGRGLGAVLRFRPPPVPGL